ncbi:MAG: class I SAM-dependent methyltransferase, partial [Actinomycetia bacterium]|nr:class I SAM-dependent methyltransferase [Actinomycetes bacterium]
LFLSADATALPIRDDSVDTILTVRVMHHLEKPEKYFDEVKRILKNGSLYLLEFANKRNLKNILRFFAGKMDTSPFNLVPSQVGETIKNYHPKDIYKKLAARDIRIKKIISVSNFRLGILKKIFGNRLLIFFEAIYQKIFSFITWGPSIFIKGYSVKVLPSGNRNLTEANLRENGRHILSYSGEQTLPDSREKASQDSGKMGSGGDKRFSGDLSRENFLNFTDILICPACHSRDLTLSGNKVKCGGCRKVFSVDGNIIDLKV